MERLIFLFRPETLTLCAGLNGPEALRILDTRRVHADSNAPQTRSRVDCWDLWIVQAGE